MSNFFDPDKEKVLASKLTDLQAITFQNQNGCVRLNYRDMPPKFWNVVYLLEINKWYYYYFWKFLNISDLEKCLLPLASTASDPCFDQGKLYVPQKKALKHCYWNLK